jgi:hypothetical protein
VFSYHFDKCKGCRQNLGKKYIAICEKNDPVVSPFVRYLSEASQVQQLNRMREILATAAYHNRPIGVPPSDQMPINLRHFPHERETEYDVIYPLGSGTERGGDGKFFLDFWRL